MNLQTKTTQQVTVKINNGKRKFLQKTFILLAILAFSGFGFKVKAQNQYVFIVTNNAPSGCDWQIVAVDINGNIYPFISSGGGTTDRFGCILDLQYFTLTYFWGGCMGYQFGSGGAFPYTSYLTTCCGASSIDCQGIVTGSSPACSSIPKTGDIHITLNIN